MSIKKSIASEGFKRFCKDVKYANIITSTQREVFGNKISKDADFDGYLKFMDLVQHRVDAKHSPYFIFSIDGNDNPVCPICKKHIAGLDTLLDSCDNYLLKREILKEYKERQIIPVQCPAGHHLTYNTNDNSLKSRNVSEIDDNFAQAKKKCLLPAIWNTIDEK